MKRKIIATAQPDRRKKRLPSQGDHSPALGRGPAGGPSERSLAAEPCPADEPSGRSSDTSKFRTPQTESACAFGIVVVHVDDDEAR